MKLNLTGLVFGSLFGGLLAAAQLHEYATIHAMLRLDEPDVYLIMASAIGVSLPLLYLVERRGFRTPLGGQFSLSRSRPERRHLEEVHCSASGGRWPGSALRPRSSCCRRARCWLSS
ncbi:MAG: hypothetical protein R2695_16195 [Acidimicrobiales bacterium]